LLTAASPEAAT